MLAQLATRGQPGQHHAQAAFLKEYEMRAHKRQETLIKPCPLKRQRFTSQAAQLRKSQVGGGKVFRESQIARAIDTIKRPTGSHYPNSSHHNIMQSFASKIKANSLSDIQDNSEEEDDEEEEESYGDYDDEEEESQEESEEQAMIEEEQEEEKEAESGEQAEKQDGALPKEEAPMTLRKATNATSQS